ncbi:unnamed protein product, partial [Effrenium voratum]
RNEPCNPTPKPGLSHLNATVEGDTTPMLQAPLRGLMFRHEMADGQAMLFRWTEDAPRSFWMENTLIPLDIIYVNFDGNIVSIKQAMPLSTRSVRSDEPASFAVEVPQGWCAKNDVSVGDRMSWNSFAHQGFVAKDAADFGASAEEVEEARRDGVLR